MAYVMAIVFLVAALITYAKGVRMDKPGSYPLMIIFVLGAAAGRMSPVASLIAVPLALIGLWLFRKESGAAKAIATVLGICAVLTVAIPHVPVPERVEEWREERERERRRAERERYRYVHFEMLGEKMAARVSSGADVLFLMSTPGDEDEFESLVEIGDIEEDITFQEWIESRTGERKNIAQENFEKGTGFSVNMVGTATVERNSDAAGFNEALAPFENEIDLILSDREIPVTEPREPTYTLEDLDFHNWDNVPEFALYLSRAYNSDMLRDYIQEGFLSSVVVLEDRVTRDTPRHEVLIAVCSDNIEDMPESPY